MLPDDIRKRLSAKDLGEVASLKRMFYQKEKPPKEIFDEYHCTRQWKLLWNAIDERADSICEECHVNKMQDLHHIRYKNRFDESLEDLQGLCRSCHKYKKGRSDFDPTQTKGNKMSRTTSQRKVSRHNVGPVVVSLYESDQDFRDCVNWQYENSMYRRNKLHKEKVSKVEKSGLKLLRGAVEHAYHEKHGDDLDITSSEFARVFNNARRLFENTPYKEPMLLSGSSNNNSIVPNRYVLEDMEDYHEIAKFEVKLLNGEEQEQKEADNSASIVLDMFGADETNVGRDDDVMAMEKEIYKKVYLERTEKRAKNMSMADLRKKVFK